MSLSRLTPPTPAPSLREALRLFSRLVIIARPFWGGIVTGLLLGVLAGLVSMIPPYLSKLYFDQVYPTRDFSLLNILVIGGGVVTLSMSLMGAMRGYYSQAIGSRLNSAVSLMFFNHLQHLPVRFYDEHQVGEVMSRFGDVRAGLGAVSNVVQALFVNGVYLLLVPPFLVAFSWRLSLVAICTVPLTVAMSTMTSRLVRTFIKRGAEAAAELNAIQVESLSQIRTVKALAAEPRVFAAMRGQTEAAMRAQLTAGAVGSVIGIANGIVRMLGACVFSWYAWTLILRGDMSLGDFMAFSAYLGYLTGPVGQLAQLFADFQQTSVSLGRAFEYLDVAPEQPPEHAYDGVGEIRVRLQGRIAFQQVTFGYDASRPVLSDVSLTLEPGSVTALVGSSGAGKSTLLRLISRMIDPQRGVITIDARPLASMSLSELRRQIGIVWQDPTLLRGTLLQNVTFGLGDVSRDAVERVLEVCQLGALVESLPQGLETPVAEWGSTLSGGQRQRLTIARALLRPARIFLLDEATSQIDVETEALLLRAVFEHVRGSTVVLATHRTAPLTTVDCVCYLQEGTLLSQGKHVELIHSCVSYRRMFESTRHGDIAVTEARSRALGALPS